MSLRTELRAAVYDLEQINTAATETVSGHRNGVDFDRKYVIAAVAKAREMMKLIAM